MPVSPVLGSIRYLGKIIQQQLPQKTLPSYLEELQLDVTGLTTQANIKNSDPVSPNGHGSALQI